MIPTMLGISFVCFLLVQLVPGGPVEEMISKAQSAAIYYSKLFYILLKFLLEVSI